MATLAARVTALAGAVRDKLNTMTPRLLPSGGSTGQILAKSSGTDYATAWTSITAVIKGLSGFCSGKPATDEVIGGGVAPYALTITQANCKAKASVAATASTVFVIKKNGTQIGTFTFAIGGTTASFSITTSAVAVDDLITVHAPTTADPTLANISFLIRE